MDEESKEFKLMKFESELFKIRFKIDNLEGEKQKELQNLREVLIEYNKLKMEKENEIKIE